MMSLETKATTTMMQINNERAYMDKNLNETEPILIGPSLPNEDCRGNYENLELHARRSKIAQLGDSFGLGISNGGAGSDGENCITIGNFTCKK